MEQLRDPLLKGNQGYIISKCLLADTRVTKQIWDMTAETEVNKHGGLWHLSGVCRLLWVTQQL